MTSAGKWVLGLLLLVVGAVFVARTVSSDPGGSSATVKNNLPGAAVAGAAKDAKDQAAVEAAAKKKIAGTIAGDLSCKKACVEVNEVAADSITTAKLAPGSVTLSKLAFEVPNLNELENEINARKAAEATVKAAQAEASAAGAKNDAAITAAASNGITQEAAARTAADEALAKNTAAADADLLSKLNTEVKDRGDADNVLQGKLNTEIADRAGAINNLRSELGNGNQVAAPIVQINNNEIVGDAVTSNKILDTTIAAADLGNDSVVGGLGGDVKDATISADDLALDSVVGGLGGDVKDNTINEDDLKSDSVIGGLGGDVKDESLTTSDLGTGSVDHDEVLTDAIRTAEIKDGEVKNVDLGADAVTTDKILDGQIKASDIDTDQVTADEILAGAVGSSEVADNSLTADDLDTDSVEADEILAGAVGTSEVADGSLTVADLGTDSVDADEIKTGAVGTLEVALNSLTADDLNTGSVGTDEIANAAILAEDLNAAFLASLATEAEVGDATADPAAVVLGGELEPNNSDSIVDWSKLKNVPNGFEDNIDDDGNGKVQDFATDLDTPDTGTGPMGPDVAANDGDGLVHFTNIDGVTITSTMLAPGSVSGGVGGAVVDGSITAADLAGEDDDQDLGTPGDQGLVAGAVNTEKILDLTIGTRDLANGAVTSAKLDVTLSTEITDLRTDLTAAEANITTLQGQITDLADPTQAGPDVASNHITGLTVVDADAVPVPVAIAAGSAGFVILPIPNVTDGDLFTLRPSGTLQNGVYVTGYEVTAPGTVTVSLFNSTAGSLTPPTTGWRVRWLDLTGAP